MVLLNFYKSYDNSIVTKSRQILIRKLIDWCQVKSSEEFFRYIHDSVCQAALFLSQVKSSEEFFRYIHDSVCQAALFLSLNVIWSVLKKSIMSYGVVDNMIESIPR